MENESVSQEELTCHTKWHALNRDQFRLKWSYKSRTRGSHFVPSFSMRRFEHYRGIRDSRKQCSIHLRVKAVYIQSIAQLKAARISTVGCATFSAGAGSEFDSQ